jgi:hypothetical protein
VLLLLWLAHLLATLAATFARCAPVLLPIWLVSELRSRHQEDMFNILSYGFGVLSLVAYVYSLGTTTPVSFQKKGFQFGKFSTPPANHLKFFYKFLKIVRINKFFLYTNKH